jgi:hypothetical protein
MSFVFKTAAAAGQDSMREREREGKEGEREALHPFLGFFVFWQSLGLNSGPCVC